MKEHLHWQSVNGEIRGTRNGVKNLRECVSHSFAKARNRSTQGQAPERLRPSGACPCGINESFNYNFAIAMNAAPFLVSFYSVDDYLSSLDEEHRVRYRPSIEALNKDRLPPIISPAALAVLFGYSPKFVHAMAEKNTNYYRSFTIKKGKKKREIKAPKVALKVIQKWFGYHLAKSIDFGEEVCGFVPGRSVLTAADQHVNAKWVYSVDIKDFFPSTPCSVVIEALEYLGYPKAGASLISKLSLKYALNKASLS